MQKLVNGKCLEALKKVGLDRVAEALALEASTFGSASASSKLEFIDEEDRVDAEFYATLTVTVHRAPNPLTGAARSTKGD